MKRNSNYNNSKQEDSQDFGLEFLNLLNEELKESKNFIKQWKLEEGFDLNKNPDKNTKKN